jgi:bacterioferritin-associated ferredoxin
MVGSFCGCCARAARGHVIPALLARSIKSRRFKPSHYLQ